jgi:protein TilB
MNIPKYLDTSLIQVNVNPTYISVRIKGKLTQLRLDEEVYSDKSIIKRSEITGELVVIMPKVNVN